MISNFITVCTQMMKTLHLYLLFLEMFVLLVHITGSASHYSLLQSYMLTHMVSSTFVSYKFLK